MTTFKKIRRTRYQIIGQTVALVALFSGCDPAEVEPAPDDLAAVSTERGAADGAGLAAPETPASTIAEGHPCLTDADCAGVSCLTSFRDADGDGYGGLAIRRCGETPPPGHVARGGDCCDADSRAHPGTPFYQSYQDQCGSFDWDCNGVVEQLPELPEVTLCGCVAQGSKFSSCVTCK